MLIYDFPDAYDLFYTEDFTEATTRYFHALFEKRRIRDVLDCAAGTGQTAIPLARLGYSVTAADINPHMLRKARQNFAKENLLAHFVKCDLTDLQTQIQREFDAVVCAGNSLAHIKNDKLGDALAQMDAVLKPGGALYIDTRNWDAILERQQRFYLYNPLVRDRGRVNFLEVWDHNRDGSLTANYLFVEEVENRIVSKRQFYALFYPFRIELLRSLLEGMHYQRIRFFKMGSPDVEDLRDADWYAVIAEKPFPNQIETKPKRRIKSDIK
jgi:glycine/sarcosine N-methyltransferase